MDNTGQHRIDMVAEGARIPLRQAVREILAVAKQIAKEDWDRGDGSYGFLGMDRWRFKRLSASYEAAVVAPWRDDARQAMQVIVSSVDLLPSGVERDAVERSIARLDADLRVAQEEKDTLLAVMQEASAWANGVFIHATVQSIANHLRAEAAELAAAPTDPEELADCLLLLGHLINRTGVDAVAVMRAKLEKNRARAWGTPNAEGYVEHVK